MHPFLLKFLFLLAISTIPTNCIVLKCRYGMNKNYGYQCTAQNFKITSKNDRSITSVVGRHFTGKTDDDVKVLHVEDNLMKYFPKDLDKFFKNLESIGIRNSELKKVTEEDLKPFGDKLEHLSLMLNRIENIPKNLLKVLPHLKTILIKNKMG